MYIFTYLTNLGTVDIKIESNSYIKALKEADKNAKEIYNTHELVETKRTIG